MNASENQTAQLVWNIKPDKNEAVSHISIFLGHARHLIFDWYGGMSSGNNKRFRGTLDGIKLTLFIKKVKSTDNADFFLLVTFTTTTPTLRDIHLMKAIRVNVQGLMRVPFFCY